MRKKRVTYTPFEWQDMVNVGVEILKKQPHIQPRQLLIFAMSRLFPESRHLSRSGIGLKQQQFYDTVILASKKDQPTVVKLTLGQLIDEALDLRFNEIKKGIDYNKTILLNILDRLGIAEKSEPRKRLLKIAVVGLLGEQASMLSQQCKYICDLTPYTNVKESTVKGFKNYDYVIITRHAAHPVSEKAKMELGSDKVFRLDTTNVSAIVEKIKELTS